LSLAFIILSRASKGFYDNASFFFLNISVPVVQFISLPINGSIALITDFKELAIAKQENKILKEENQKLRSFFIQAININNENKELKEILKFIKPKSSSFRSAKIIGKSSELFNQKLFMDVGKNQDIAEGNIVTGRFSMIGRVIDVEENKSRLMLLTDANSHIPIIMSNARARGILTGNNSRIMEVSYLPNNHNIKVGDTVFTSGDGDTIHPSFLVGVVKMSSKSFVGVEMAEDVDSINIVTIVK
jgi:rod shape-determining protein MreC